MTNTNATRKKKQPKIVRWGIAVRPQDAALIEQLRLKLSTPLSQPGTTDIVRMGLEALAEKVA